jgi:polyisoprenoid-binding protein YceI
MRKSLAALAVVLAISTPAVAAPESYTLDQYHTYPHFTIDYIGYMTMRGRFDKTAGKFTMDRAARTGSLDVAIEAASVTTGDNERAGRPRTRDEHLRAADFFNVAEFPRITYKSSGVKFAADAPSEIEGQLSMNGVTRPVALKIEKWKCAMHPFWKKEACGGDATARIKRSDFGIKFGLPALGDEIALHIPFVATKD